RPRGRVEGDLLPSGLARVSALLLGVADDRERRRRVREVLTLAPGRHEAFVHGGLHVLAQVLRAVERMDVQAIADLAGDPAHQAIHARDVDRDLRMLDRPRVEERGHEIEAIELAGEVELRPVLPAIPDGPQSEDDLPPPLARRLE